MLVIAAVAVVVAIVVRAQPLRPGAGRHRRRRAARRRRSGVDTRWVKIAGFALSAAFAGAAGAAMAVRWTYIDPTAVFNPFIGFQTVLIAIDRRRR